MRLSALPCVLLLAFAVLVARADDTLDDFARVRHGLAEDNPAELWVQRGAELWHAPAGPRQVPLELCDLGLGPGQVRGAFAQLPRWFDDAGQVMDIEQRLIWCMTTLQGLTAQEASRNHFGDGARQSPMEALVAWLASQSRGMPVDVPATRPAEQRLLALGRRLFYYRAGPYDFACATCHSGQHLRIRLQELPNLTDPGDARRSFTTWPAYRLSQGEVRTMEHRLYDCFRQQRFPEAVYGSDAITALTLLMAHDAQGGLIDAPSIKR